MCLTNHVAVSAFADASAEVTSTASQKVLTTTVADIALVESNAISDGCDLARNQQSSVAVQNKFPTTLLVELQRWLGMSGSGKIGSVCRPWAEDLREVAVRIRAPLFAGLGAETHLALLKVLGAPKLNPGSGFLGSDLDLAAEDDVFAVLSAGHSEQQLPEMLRACSSICAYTEVQNQIATLRPRCMLPQKVLDELFQPCVEREKTLQFSPRPLHCAVIRSSATTTKLLLSAARCAGILEEVLEKEKGLDGQLFLSPMFLAVLFANKDVAEILKAAGGAPNAVDVQAAMRLHRAGIWDDFVARAELLGLVSVAQQLTDGVVEFRAQVKRYRDQVRRALMSN